MTDLENILQKRQQAQSIMADMDMSAWVIIVADNSAEDAHLPLIGAPKGASSRAYILTPEAPVAVSHQIEADAQTESGFQTIVYGPEGLIGRLSSEIPNHVSNGARIAVNYSIQFADVDTLGHGRYVKLSDSLVKSGFYSDSLKASQGLVSADQLIFRVSSTKLPSEVEKLKQAALITNQVLIEGFSRMKSGMTEKGVAAIIQGIAEEMFMGNSNLGYSWTKELNPIVLTGEGIQGSPHAAPSNRVIEKGNTVYVDFGISFDGYNGDLQHFGYVLRDGEAQAPEDVQRMYDVLVKSINAGMKKSVPGVMGWEVDKACRDVIVNAGFPSYGHSTGHQLGSGNTHSPGVTFGPRYANYTNEESDSLRVNDVASLPIEKGYVMTIEPRIQIPNGASIEVDGIVTERGFELLAPMQDKIHLIRE